MFYTCVSFCSWWGEVGFPACTGRGVGFPACTGKVGLASLHALGRGVGIAFDTCFVFDLICLFWVNSVYLLCWFRRKFFSIGIDINFDIWLNIIYSRCFIDIFW